MDLSFPGSQGKAGKVPDSTEPDGVERTGTWRLPDVPPVLSEDIAFLVKHGCSFGMLIEVEKRSRRLNLPAATVLIANGYMTQATYYRLVARELGLQYCSKAPGDSRPYTLPRNPEALHSLARVLPMASSGTALNFHFGPRHYYLAPDANLFRLLKAHIKRAPRISNRIKVSSYDSNLDNLISRSSPALLARATSGLSDSLPRLSAKQTFTVVQAVALLLLVQAVIGLSVLFETMVPVLLHLAALYLYVGRAGMRMSAWFRLGRSPRMQDIEQLKDEELSFYSVLVALYDEGEVVAELVAALARLDWPPELLEIKLICEADDHETVKACEQAIKSAPLPVFSMVKVPACEPRTKPKALNYALPLCRGEFVVVYDAEDRPDPAQLKQAFVTFRDGREDLACLQAPLVIENHTSGWLARMFAIEYSALFDGLLPAMGRKRLPMPLGGSSNHFKRRVLVKIGAWDPFNVTEDADLGLRLARAGCRADVITCPTYETAPTDLKVWMRQRTRWFKGWYQTFLVHSRHPWQLKQDLGLHGLMSFLLTTLGLALSALANPFLFIAMIAIAAEALASNVPVWKLCLLVTDSFSIIVSYGVFVLLAARTLKLRNLRSLRHCLWMLPAYWLLMSFAAWRALWQLVRCPHKWEKTPHLRRELESAQQGADLR